MSYLQYLDALISAEKDPIHQDLSKDIRSSKDYERYANLNAMRIITIRKASSYIIALHAYVLSFTKKTQPLVDVASQQKQAEEQFDLLWSKGEIAGWADQENIEMVAKGEGIWCSACEYFHVWLLFNHSLTVFM